VRPGATFRRVRRLPLIIAALLVPVVPAVVAAPAYAVDHVICVGSPGGPCDETAGSISAALTAASGNGFDDTVRVGPGTWSDGPYVLDGTGEGLVLRGSGPDTVITLAPSPVPDTYVNVQHATLRDVTVVLAGQDSGNDHAVNANNGASVVGVDVDGTTTQSATGFEVQNADLSDVEVHMALDADSTAVFAQGGSLVADSVLEADNAFKASSTAAPDALSRSTLLVGYASGVSSDSGTVEVDDTVIDLGTRGGTGVQAANFNPGTTPISVVAEHLTVVGGDPASIGVHAYAVSETVRQSAAVTLLNSVVHGPATSLLAEADTGVVGGPPSTATIAVGHSDYQTTSEVIGAHGSGGVVDNGGNLADVDPHFVDPAAGDYHLAAASPLIDQGDPADGPPTLDRDGSLRVVDGDLDGSAVRDLGAYEYADTVAPQTEITSGPGGLTANPTPTFTFTSESGATFECKVGGSAWAGCASPVTTAPLPDGSTTFRVRASDGWGNVDPTPASRSFRVDTTAPQTRLTDHPPKRTTKRKVAFAFTSERGATFACNLDRTGWKACTSPRTYRVTTGWHRFWVMAVDKAGNNDPTPATFRFRRR
jgi:hypothetical protein